MRKGQKNWFALMLLSLLTAVQLTLAGTGGAELNDAWTWVSDALSGTLGKLVAAGILGAAVFTLVRGAIIFGIFLFLLALLVALIPGIIDNRYTLTLIGL